MPLMVLFSMLLTGLSLATPLRAQPLQAPKGVVELFTSQGCSSCPPADAALEKLVAQGNVVALSYHVDYWNYLGWADTMSSKENTERQYGYARTLGRSNVYTPQAVINGRDHMNGADLDAINGKIDAMSVSGTGLTVDVSAKLEGDALKINVGAGSGKANIVVAYFRQQQVINVESGENSGRQISYWHAVTDVQTVGKWDGKEINVTLPASVIGIGKKDGCAILLQTSGPGAEPAAILGAAVVTVAKHN